MEFINKNKGAIVVIIVLGLLALGFYFANRNKTKKEVNDNLNDYEGDEYEGTYSFVGDYESYTATKGREIAHARKTLLYKVLEPVNILKYERDKEGSLTLIRTGRQLKKGSQLKVYQDTIKKPLVKNDKTFVQYMGGEFWVRFDKITKV